MSQSGGSSIREVQMKHVIRWKKTDNKNDETRIKVAVKNDPPKVSVKVKKTD